jgi:hypothetical protein
MWEYVVGGAIAVGGTAFALFNAWASVQDDRRHEADEHAAVASPSRGKPQRAA